MTATPVFFDCRSNRPHPVRRSARFGHRPRLTAHQWCNLSPAQQADAAVGIAKAYLRGSSAEVGSPAVADNYQVVVQVDEAALRGGAGRSDLPVETVRRLSCDGCVIRIKEGENGAMLDIGRKTCTVPAAIRRALRARDRGCRFPGCAHRHYLDAHHIVPWARGGETRLDNMILLCTQHHRLLHEGGFSICSDQHGEFGFARSDGRVIPRCGYRVDDVVDGDQDIVESIDRLVARVSREKLEYAFLGEVDDGAVADAGILRESQESETRRFVRSGFHDFPRRVVDLFADD